MKNMLYFCPYLIQLHACMDKIKLCVCRVLTPKRGTISLDIIMVISWMQEGFFCVKYYGKEYFNIQKLEFSDLLKVSWRESRDEML